MGREPDIGRIAKKLTKKQFDCNDEIRALMDCMTKFAATEADASCARQKAALALCTQQAATKSTSKTQIAYHLRRLTQLWKKFGY